MKMKMKKQSGVTLVALVVTIIVLIILVGISINLALGDNGIITLAKKSKENTELAKIEEEQQLNELYKELETEGGNSSTGTNDGVISTSLPDITFSCSAGQYGTETGSSLVTTIPAGYTKITVSGGVASLYKNNTALSTTTGTYDTTAGDVWKCGSHWHGATISFTLSAN